jgi:hypothetical protein
MPATTTELCAHVRRLIAGEVMPDSVPLWEDQSTATEAEMRTIEGILRYEAILALGRQDKAEQRPAQRKARRLLRSILTADQVSELRRRRCFTVVAASGRHYRLDPACGKVTEVERHGKNFYERRSFCLHPDPEHTLPPADITVAQMCLLLADEHTFLEEANVTEHRSLLWDGNWLRTLNEHRRDAAAASGEVA